MIPLIGAEYPKKVIPLIDNAKKNIDIIVYDWRWYSDQIGHPVQQFNMALVRAVKRGVSVRCLLNAPLLFQTLNSVGIRAKLLKDRRTLHSKLIIIDESKLIIGSHNFTRNGFGTNIESSVIVDIPPDVTRFREFFENMYNI